MDKRVTPPKRVTSHLPGVPPPPRKQDLSYTFFGGNVVRVLVHFFFTAVHFHLALVVASISHFVTAATKFSSSSSNNKLSCFVVYLFIFFLGFAGLPPIFSFFSLFLLLYIPNFWT